MRVPIEITTAVPDDAPAILRIFAERGLVLPEGMVPDTSGGKAFVVARVDGVTLAFCILGFEGPHSVEVTELWCRPVPLGMRALSKLADWIEGKVQEFATQRHERLWLIGYLHGDNRGVEYLHRRGYTIYDGPQPHLVKVAREFFSQVAYVEVPA